MVLPRQKGPLGHSINVDLKNRFAAAADLGTDDVFVYRFDAGAGTLTPNDPPLVEMTPGAGPRHFAFHPNGKAAYVINEMNCTMTAFEWDGEKGTLKPVQTISTLGSDAMKDGYSTAEVQVHPSGQFVYGSNRGHDTIVVYKVDGQTGKLTYVENESTQGKIPRNFGIDPTGTYLLAANQESDSVVVFRINKETGALDATGVKIEVPKPVCVKFLVL